MEEGLTNLYAVEVLQMKTQIAAQKIMHNEFKMLLSLSNVVKY
jgi:hypothetical protein